MDRGDETLRLNYDLDSSAVIIDAGGYQGQWSSDIFAKYGCTIHIFEPVPQFAASILQRFQNNEKLHIYEYGLADATRLATIAVSDDASSLLRGQENIQAIKLK